MAYCKLFTNFAAVFNKIKFYLMKTTIEELKWYIENRELILRALHICSIYYEKTKIAEHLYIKKWHELYQLQNKIES